MATDTARHVLSEALLVRCQERAPGYDRDNRFFQEDFDELRNAGYLLSAVPKELGGLGPHPPSPYSSEPRVSSPDSSGHQPGRAASVGIGAPKEYAWCGAAFGGDAPPLPGPAEGLLVDFLD